MEEFRKLGLSENIINALRKKGYSKPTSIQEKAIPILLEGKIDVVGKSKTGTGKTASFAVPIIEIITQSRHVQAIVLTPTRELAIQVAKEFDSLKGNKRLRILAVYGGASMENQVRALRSGVDIVVGTPGRIIDHLKRKNLDLSKVSFAVLDEADEMLNMGFLEDIEHILSKTNPTKQMILFSATMPPEILKIARRFMGKYVTLEVESAELVINLIKQIYFEIHANNRFEGLRRIIDINYDFYGIIFCKTRAQVDQLARQLTEAGYQVAALHGDISQNQREKLLSQFRKKIVNILVATDVAARGIDVSDLTHVINYSVPQNPESYIHRIGRTGRAGKKGVAITLVIPSEKRMLRFIEKITKAPLERHQLPSIAEIIKVRQAYLRSIVEKTISDKTAKFERMAQDLLHKHNAKEVISALLQIAFKEEIDARQYKEIKSPIEGKKFPKKSHRRTGRHRYRREK